MIFIFIIHTCIYTSTLWQLDKNSINNSSFNALEFQRVNEILLKIKSNVVSFENWTKLSREQFVNMNDINLNQQRFELSGLISDAHANSFSASEQATNLLTNPSWQTDQPPMQTILSWYWLFQNYESYNWWLLVNCTPISTIFL